MTENLCVLGSTGSIGTNTLEVVRKNPHLFDVVALSGHQNITLLADQIKEFSPEMVSVSKGNAEPLKELLKKESHLPIIFENAEGLQKLVLNPKVKRVVSGISGSAGLDSAYQCVTAGKILVTANKEPLVIAGELIMRTAHKKGAKILPIDSEHNAIFQALKGNSVQDVVDITLVASGGPFFKKPVSEFSKITPEQALQHPNWKMGKKVTIDSATLMNKALEIIEARWLFDLPPEKIRVLIHPQSIIHSLVTYKDNSSIAQMGNPDMKIPISYCLSDERIKNNSKPLDLAKISNLEFYEPDLEKFPTLGYAYEILNLPATASAMFNGANEILVELFLQKKIPFTEIFNQLKLLVRELRNSFSAPDNSLPRTINSVSEGLSRNEAGKQKILENLDTALS